MEDADGQVRMMGIIEEMAQQATATGRCQGYLWLDAERSCCDVQYKQTALVILNCALLEANAVPSSPDQRALATIKPIQIRQEREWDEKP